MITTSSHKTGLQLPPTEAEKVLAQPLGLNDSIPPENEVFAKLYDQLRTTPVHFVEHLPVTKSWGTPSSGAGPSSTRDLGLLEELFINTTERSKSVPIGITGPTTFRTTKARISRDFEGVVVNPELVRSTDETHRTLKKGYALMYDYFAARLGHEEVLRDEDPEQMVDDEAKNHTTSFKKGKPTKSGRLKQFITQKQKNLDAWKAKFMKK